MSWIKTIAKNVFVLFFIFGVILVVPPLLYPIYKAVDNSVDKRGQLDLYKEFDWSAKHFEEVSSLTTTYHDFITWRRDDFAGETINIKNGLRKTILPEVLNKDANKYWFFGGSTTWGSGTSDSYTYPSLFAQKTKTDVINFGETGYIARQSLDYLVNQIITTNTQSLSNIHVIFYDGYNDVSTACTRRENIGLGSSREDQIKNMLKKEEDKFSPKKTFEQLYNILTMVVERYGLNKKSNPTLNCYTNDKFALKVAENIVNTWQIASELVKAKGGNFTAILQPVAFIGAPDTRYLNLNSSSDMALSLKAVYPLIIKIAKKREINFVDLTNAYDGCNNCYIDICHVGPQGHKHLVEKLNIFFD